MKTTWTRDYPLFLLAFCLPIIPLARIVINPVMGAMKEGLIAGVSVLALVRGFNVRIDAPRITFGASLIFLYIGYVLLHVLISDQGLSASSESARYLLLYPVLAAVLVSSSNDIKDPVRIARWVSILFAFVFASAVVVAAIGMYQKYLNPDFIDLYGGRRVHGDYLGIRNLRLVSTMENPISLGFFLQVGLVSAYFLGRTVANPWRKAAIAACAALFCYTAVLTISRSAFLIMGILAAFLVLKSLALGSMGAKVRTMAILAAGAIAARTVWSRFSGGEFGILDVLNNRLFELVDANSLDSDLRIVMWKMKVLPFLDSSVVEILFGKGLGHLGWGPGTFVMENGYLALLFELGLVGLVLFLVVVGKAAYNAFVLSMHPDGTFRAFGTSMQLFLLVYGAAMVMADVHMSLPLVFYFWVFYAASEILVSTLPGSGTGRAAS